MESENRISDQQTNKVHEQNQPNTNFQHRRRSDTYFLLEKIYSTSDHKSVQKNLTRPLGKTLRNKQPLINETSPNDHTHTKYDTRKHNTTLVFSTVRPLKLMQQMQIQVLSHRS